MTHDEAMSRLEDAIELAEKPEYACMTMSALLCELYRKAQTGFTQREAECFADRLGELCNSLNTSL